MSVTTASEMTEIELLHFYLGRRIAKGGRDLTIDEALRGYAEYRRQLDDFRAKLREAEESSALGLAKPVDREEMKREVRQVLEGKGVTE